MITIDRAGHFTGATGYAQVLRALAQQATHEKAGALTAITNNIGGSGSAVAKVADFTNVADDSTSLADKTETEAALTTVKNAITELGAAVNSIAAVTGISTLTVSTGGATADGTVAAVTASVAAAATGSQASNTNALVAIINNSTFALAKKANEIAEACGIAGVTIGSFGTTAFSSTLAALGTGTGTAADPGISKADMDAALEIMRDNLTAIGAVLVAAATAPTAVSVRASL